MFYLFPIKAESVQQDFWPDFTVQFKFIFHEYLKWQFHFLGQTRPISTHGLSPLTTRPIYLFYFTVRILLIQRIEFGCLLSFPFPLYAYLCSFKFEKMKIACFQCKEIESKLIFVYSQELFLNSFQTGSSSFWFYFLEPCHRDQGEWDVISMSYCLFHGYDPSSRCIVSKAGILWSSQCVIKYRHQLG